MQVVCRCTHSVCVECQQSEDGGFEVFASGPMQHSYAATVLGTQCSLQA